MNVADTSMILGTRASALALWQANYVKARLQVHGHRVELQEITTTGDRILDVPLAEIGEKGLFTKELDLALIEGRIHLAVHSLKDLPTTLPTGITLAAVTERAAPWDAFVAHPAFAGELADLPEGAMLATSSLRRQAQLRVWRRDLLLVASRGNVDTRLRKLDAGEVHGLILAEAGLVRLGLNDRIRQRVPFSIMIPAVGQGALGIVCGDHDVKTQAILRESLHHAPTAAAVTAERAFLRLLEGGCQAPIGAHAQFIDKRLRLDGCVAALDGSRLVRRHCTGMPEDAEVLGRILAEDVLTHGADAILGAIRTPR